MDNTRRYRGMLGLAATWGVALSVLATSALVIGLATGLVPTSIYGVREIVGVAVRGLLVGGTAGGIFGWLLSAKEAHRSIETLPPKRAALWGSIAAAGGLALLALAAAGPVLPLGVLAAGVAGTAIGGGIFATSLLRLARRPAKALTATPGDASRLIR